MKKKNPNIVAVIVLLFIAVYFIAGYCVRYKLDIKESALYEYYEASEAYINKLEEAIGEDYLLDVLSEGDEYADYMEKKNNL